MLGFSSPFRLATTVMFVGLILYAVVAASLDGEYAYAAFFALCAPIIASGMWAKDRIFAQRRSGDRSVDKTALMVSLGGIVVLTLGVIVLAVVK